MRVADVCKILYLAHICFFLYHPYYMIKRSAAGAFTWHIMFVEYSPEHAYPLVGQGYGTISFDFFQNFRR